MVTLRNVDFLPFYNCEVLTVHPFSTLLVCLISTKVDSPFCQNPLLHNLYSFVKLSLFHVVFEIIYVGADVDLVAYSILKTHVLGASVSGEESCVQINSQCCSNSVVGRGEDGLYIISLVLPIFCVPLDNAK